MTGFVTMLAAQVIWIVVALYAAAGLMVAAAFVTFGIGRVDAAARGAGWGFRMLILLGCVLLWPLIAARWLRARASGEGR
jgi:hypothetical protein